MYSLTGVSVALALLGSRVAEPNKWAPYFLSKIVYDSNINRDRTYVHSIGSIFGVGLDYKDNARRPKFELNMDVAKHEYSSSSRYDRVSYGARGTYHHRLSDQWRGELLTGANINGTTDDRELFDTYYAEPRIEYRLPHQQRLRVGANFRIRHSRVDPGRDAKNNYFTLAYQYRPRGNVAELNYRYEVNTADNRRNSFLRWTYGIHFERTVDTRTSFTIDVRNRPRRFMSRTFNGRLRFDNSWFIEAGVLHQLSERLTASLDLKYEIRASNDPRRGYQDYTIVSGFNWQF